MKYTLYCDGSTKGNGKENAVGAWAFAVIGEDGVKLYEQSGTMIPATNQHTQLL